jgi:mersacidin/lichenicidin family type 2 lantibiotic
MDHINISDIDLVRAWKDEEYWNSLSEEQKALLPENPAGLIDLTDEALNGVVGGVIEELPVGCTRRPPS